MDPAEQTRVGRLIYSSHVHKMLLSCLPDLCCSHLTSSLEGWNFITVMNLCFFFPAPGGFKRACAKMLSPCSAVYNLGYMQLDFTWELERMEEICHKTFATLVTSAFENTVYQPRRRLALWNRSLALINKASRKTQWRVKVVVWNTEVIWDVELMYLPTNRFRVEKDRAAFLT